MRKSSTGELQPRLMIERLRLELRLNQTEFGKRLGVSAMTVSRWENGVTPIPASGYIALAKLAKTKSDAWVFLGLAGLSKADVTRK